MTNKYQKTKIKKKIILESFFVFFIAISPFLSKLYDYLPEDPNAVVSFLGFEIGNNGFPDVSTFIWFIMNKIIPLYLLIFWFMTAKNWWYHIIIIPIAMYAFQLIEVVTDSDDIVDTENIWWVIPICMVVIPVVYFIRIKLYDKYVHGIDIEAMERELKIIKYKQRKKAQREEDTLEIQEPTLDSATEKKYEVEEKFKIYSFSEEINRKLSTHNLEKQFKSLQKKIFGSRDKKSSQSL